MKKRRYSPIWTFLAFLILTLFVIFVVYPLILILYKSVINPSDNSLTFADTESECSQWTLEQQSDGTWYIKNVGAAYNGNHNQALEYFNGFTTYGVKTDNAAYKFDSNTTVQQTLSGMPNGVYLLKAQASPMS